MIYALLDFAKILWDNFFELWDEDETNPNNDESVCIVGQRLDDDGAGDPNLSLSHVNLVR